MATVTYTLGEKHSKSGFGGGFAHILGKDEGLSREYVFGRADESIAPKDVTYSHEVSGADLDVFRELLADKRLDRAEFHLAEDAAKPVAK